MGWPYWKRFVDGTININNDTYSTSTSEVNVMVLISFLVQLIFDISVLFVKHLALKAELRSGYCDDIGENWRCTTAPNDLLYKCYDCYHFYAFSREFMSHKHIPYWQKWQKLKNEQPPTSLIKCCPTAIINDFYRYSIFCLEAIICQIKKYILSYPTWSSLVRFIDYNFNIFVHQ